MGERTQTTAKINRNFQIDNRKEIPLLSIPSKVHVNTLNYSRSDITDTRGKGMQTMSTKRDYVKMPKKLCIQCGGL